MKKKKKNGRVIVASHWVVMKMKKWTIERAKKMMKREVVAQHQESLLDSIQRR